MLTIPEVFSGKTAAPTPTPLTPRKKERKVHSQTTLQGQGFEEPREKAAVMLSLLWMLLKVVN